MTRRREFLKSTAGVGLATGLSGCLSIFDNSPRVEIVKPKEGGQVGKNLSVNITVENFDLRSASGPDFEDQGGRAVLIIGDRLPEDKSISEVDRAYDVFGSEQMTQFELIDPEKKTLTVQLVNDNGEALNSYSEIEINPEFEVPDTVSIGEDNRPSVKPGVLEIPIDTEVTFKWGFNGVGIEVNSKPEESDWTGVSTPQREGYTHKHEFTEAGVYKYSCPPFSGVMSGQIRVIERG